MSPTQRQATPSRRATPRFLLEDCATGLYAVATDKGLQLAKRPDATEYLTRADALIAAGTQAVEVVRVDA